MQRLIEGNGGDVTKHPSSEYLSHCVLSAQLWGKQGTKNPDHILRELVKRNQENATEDDPDHNVRWPVRSLGHDAARLSGEEPSSSTPSRPLLRRLA